MLIPAPVCRFLAVVSVLALLSAPPVAALLGRGISAQQFAFTGGFLVPFAATGLYAFWRRPDLPVARLLLTAGSLWALFASGDFLLRAVLEQDPDAPGLWIANLVLLGVGCACFAVALTLLALFPDGRYQRAYERRFIRPLWSLPVAVPLLAALLTPRFHLAYDRSTPEIPNPAAILDGVGLEKVPEGLFSGLATSFLPVGVALLALRYRRLGAEQRAQVRWLLWVCIVGLMVGIGLAVLSARGSGLVDIVFMIVGYGFLALVPVAILIAILRYRLLNVDVLIRKSLVYGTLWLLIVAVYVLAAAALGVAVGGQLPVSVAILLTVVATLAFQPARRRLEQLANRWVFGEPTNRYELLAAFGADLERTLSLDELLPRLAGTVQRGLDASWARISVTQGSDGDAVLVPRAAAGIEPDARAEPTLSSRLHVADSNTAVGVIECGPRREGKYSDQDRSLLETLARQAALAVRNAGLASELSARLDEIRIHADELAASRSRIVHAQETERRRIERNIHDGAQQELVALIASLRLARNQLERDPVSAGATLAGLQEAVIATLNDLRNLAQGIHPAVLSDKGLLAALEARARTAQVAVAISADPAARRLRFDDDVEGAAYFFACEALVNALKHGRADSIELTVTHDQGWLSVEVSDDGVGFEPATTPKRGLANLGDRAAALGGHFHLESEPGRGTTVRCALPAPIREAAHV
ncbi:histidine kinase-like protein [Kribbella sp. VKM Ac-2527]|uniref:histidine kinase n=1 Tax=Kribbella caucasensis TaxID=2512215 RepID=A0A4R6JBX4_9ACTN|nr:histidine kinase-like protein [Kribbella sp. VKM Ac-2527]